MTLGGVKGKFHDLLDLRVGRGIANGTLTLYFEDVPESDMDLVISKYKSFRKMLLPIMGHSKEPSLPKKLHRDITEFVPGSDPPHIKESKPRRDEVTGQKAQASLECGPVTKGRRFQLKSVSDAISAAAINGDEPHGGEFTAGCMVNQIMPFQNGEKYFGKLRVEKVDQSKGDILVAVKLSAEDVKKVWKPMKYFTVIQK